MGKNKLEKSEDDYLSTQDIYSRNQKELEEELKLLETSSTEYRRRIDWIQIIQDKTNNIQTANQIAQISSDSKKADNRAFWATILAVVTLVATIFSIYQQIESNNLTQRSLELSSQPTITLNVRDELSGMLSFASSTIYFDLKNTSLANYKDILVNISLFQTYYDFNSGHLVTTPVAQYWNENNEIFRSYSLWENSSLNSQSFSLSSLKNKTFQFDPSSFLESQGDCPVESKDLAYHGKFKYFFRVDIKYVREIDNVNYWQTDYYALDKSGYLVNLNNRKDGLSWVIDDDDNGDAIFIIPFKSEIFVSHLNNNRPPYTDLVVERFNYDPQKNMIYLNSAGSRTFEACFKIDKNTLDFINGRKEK